MDCKVERVNGRLTININGKNYPPYSFKTWRPDNRNIAEFYGAGIRLFNVFTGTLISGIGVPYCLYGETWIDDEVYEFSPLDKQMDFYIENAPDAYFCVMLQMDTRQWWLDKYKNYPYSFTHMSQMEADTKWRNLASKYMQATMKHLEEKYGEKIYGYFLTCGTTTEWYSDYSHEEPSDLMQREFKKYVKDNSVSVPDKETRETDENTVFLTEEKDGLLISYRKFEAWQRADTIEYFLEKAQEIANHKKLIGIYYGYMLELEGPRLWETGYLDNERIFKSDNLDMICSPMSYQYRGLDQASEYMITRNTLDTHNKIYFLEHDHKTCLTDNYFNGFKFIHPYKSQTVEEDIDRMRRDFMLAFSYDMAFWWFDMLGGWWYDNRFMSEIEKMLSITNEFYNVKYESVNEIAVIIDPESMYYVNKNTKLNDMNLNSQRPDLSYMGAGYDCYSACDMENIDRNKYKLFIFLNSFKKSENLVRFVDKLKAEKKTILFSYACNLVKEKIDNQGMSELLGMKVSFAGIEDAVIIDGKEYKAGDITPVWATSERIPNNKGLECLKIDDGAICMGTFKNSGACGIGCKTDGYNVIFSGLQSIKEPILRKAIKMSGVHSYLDNSDNIIYPCNVGLGLYHRLEKDAAIHVREDGVYVDVFEDKEYVSKNGILEVPYDNKRAKLLIVRQ